MGTIVSINGPENFNLLNQRQFSEIIQRSQKLAQTARELNCNLLMPVPSPMQPGLSSNEIQAQTAESLIKLADCCGEDINLGLEFLGVSECSVNNLKDAIAIVKRVNRKNVGLVLDSFHLYLSGSEVTELKEDRDRIFLVHVNDSEAEERAILRDANRLFPGEGVIDLKRLALDLTQQIRRIIVVDSDDDISVSYVVYPRYVFVSKRCSNFM